jgi:hypothetical protein
MPADADDRAGPPAGARGEPAVARDEPAGPPGPLARDERTALTTPPPAAGHVAGAPSFDGRLEWRPLRAELFVAMGAFLAAGLALALVPDAPLPWPLPLLGVVALLPFAGLRRSRPARVTAAPRRLAVGGGPERAVSSGHLHVDLRGVATLRLRTSAPSRRTLELATDDAEQGRRLLAALRLDAANAAATFRVIGGSWPRLRYQRALTAGVVAGALLGALLIFVTPFLLLGLALGAVAWCARYVLTWRVPVRAEVGLDGLAARNAYGQTRYLPFEAVESIAGRRRDTVLFTHAGERVAFGARRLDENEAFAQRLAEAFSLYREAKPLSPEHYEPLLPAADPTAEAWLERLRALGTDRTQPYRSPGLERARLLDVALSPSAPPLARAAAAVVLRHAASPEELARLRAAADATAYPELRAALAPRARGARDESSAALCRLYTAWSAERTLPRAGELATDRSPRGAFPRAPRA